MPTDFLGTHNFAEAPTVNGAPVLVLNGETTGILSFSSGSIPAISGTTLIPADNTEPLISEGSEILTLTVTPKSVLSKFIFTANLHGSVSTNARTLTASLFRNGVLIGVVGHYYAIAARPQMFSLYNINIPGVITPVTYSLRFGVSSAATLWTVSTTSGISYNNTALSIWSLTEI